MRLTTYTDYALRVLIRLALQPDRLTTIADIAKGYGISENHLMKVVHQLGVAGFIDTVRGRNGGLRLRKSAGRDQCRPGRPPDGAGYGYCPLLQRRPALVSSNPPVCLKARSPRQGMRF